MMKDGSPRRHITFTHYMDSFRKLVVPVAIMSSFFLNQSHLRKLGIVPNQHARVFRFQSALSYSFSEKSGHIRVPAPLHSSYRVAGLQIDSDRDDDLSSSSDCGTTPNQVEPPPTPPPSEPTKPFEDAALTPGDVSFANRGKPTSPRSFSNPAHSSIFAFLTSGILPARLQLHAHLSASVKSLRRSRAKNFKANARRRYKIQDGRLHYNTALRRKKTAAAQAISAISPWRTIPFADEEYDIVHNAHHAHHENVNALEAVIKRKWMIRNVRSIAQHVRRRCSKCENYAPPHKVGPVWILTDRPLQLVMFDLSKLPITLHDGTEVYLLLVVDHFTKYKWFKLVLGKATTPICEYLTLLFRREGTPERWHADNGREFKNQFIDTVRENLSLNDGDGLLPYTHSLPRNPQCQGLVERGNRTVKVRLGKKYSEFVDQHPGAETTLQVLTDLTTEVIDGVNTGPVKLYGNITPHLLQRGRPHLMSQFSHLPATMLERLYQECAEAQVKRASQGTEEMRTRSDIFRTYALGSVVMVACKTQSLKKKEAPLGQRWPWLATIARRCEGADDCYKLRWVSQGPTTYDKPGVVGRRYFHVVQLKPGTPEQQEKYGVHVQEVEDARDVSDDEWQYDSSDAHEEFSDDAADEHQHAGEQFEVEAILDRRLNVRGQEEFKIKWVGFGSTYDSWEPGHVIRKSCEYLFWNFARSRWCAQCMQFQDNESERSLRTCRNCKDKVCYSDREGTACCWSTPFWTDGEFCASCMEHLEKVNSGEATLCFRCGKTDAMIDGDAGWSLRVCGKCDRHVCFSEGVDSGSCCWNNYTWEGEVCCAACMENDDSLEQGKFSQASHTATPAPSEDKETVPEHRASGVTFEHAMNRYMQSSRTRFPEKQIRFEHTSPSETAIVADALKIGIDRFLVEEMHDRTVIVQPENMKKAHDGFMSDEFIAAALSLYQLAGERGRCRVNIFFTTFESLLQVYDTRSKLERRLARSLKYCKVERVELIFLPINDAANLHWFLVVADVTRQKVLVFDSLRSNKLAGWAKHPMYDVAVRTCERFVSGLSSIAAKESLTPGRFDFIRKQIRTAQIHGMIQADGTSCGVFLLLTARALIEGRLPVYESTDGMPAARKRLLLEVFNNNLQPYAEHFVDDLPPLWRTLKRSRPLSKSILSSDEESSPP